MDAAYIARYKERSAYEEARTEPPEGFPKLPDLPLGRYTDPEFYGLEREYLWKKVWLYAAHDSELPTPGSYKLTDIAGAPVLLVRGDDGVVRAFYNACRHRGAPVVRGECGSARRRSRRLAEVADIAICWPTIRTAGARKLHLCIEAADSDE